jgi:serine-type D-Ala-D-Ala carboxypeptidase (penicillin-binding protein 5/6)
VIFCYDMTMAKKKLLKPKVIKPILIKSQPLKEELRTYLKRLTKTRQRTILTIALVLFFLTIPNTIPYPIYDIPEGKPIYHQIKASIPTPDPYPINTTGLQAPYVSAQSAIVIDVDSKAVMYMKNPDLKLSPASTTKMLTALVTIDQYKLDKVASVSSPLRVGQIMFLQQDENITVENLLKGLLIHSANDAAYALADLDPNGMDGFIAKMNRQLEKYGLKDSYFLEPAGLSNGKHLATVHDLVIIGSHLMENEMLAKIVSTKSETVYDVTKTIPHELTAINQLLDKVPGMKGIKTGWTESAGECFVSYVDRDGHRIITAVLGSYDRFGETVKLVDWAYENHQWQTIDTTGLYD